MDSYFDVTIGPDGTLQLPPRVLEARGWTPGQTLTVMDTVHGLVLNEIEELERLVALRLAGFDPLAAFAEEKKTKPFGP